MCCYEANGAAFCASGLTCCDWDSVAGAQAKEGTCGEMCIQGGPVIIEPEPAVCALELRRHLQAFADARRHSVSAPIYIEVHEPPWTVHRSP